MSRLKEQYQNEIVDAMIKKFGYKNIMEVPKLDKIVVNMGVGEAKENPTIIRCNRSRSRHGRNSRASARRRSAKLRVSPGFRPPT